MIQTTEIISRHINIGSGGIMLLIDKPKDYSSARVVNIIKKKLNIKKAGHSGTLDPQATGLMIVCTHKMTKQLNSLLDSDKEYEGIIMLGERTKSFDSETGVTDKKDTSGITYEMIFDNVKNFIGEVEQIPPMYSAVKHKGKPLYKYARKDVEIERKIRKVTITEFEIQKIELPEVTFRVKCSKGTYIRTLANDFGDKLGTGAYLKELRRLKIGDYDVRDSIALEEFLQDNITFSIN